MVTYPFTPPDTTLYHNRQDFANALETGGARQILARLRPSCQIRRKVLIATHNQAGLLPKVGQDAKKRASTGVTMCFSDRCRYPGWRLQELDGHLETGAGSIQKALRALSYSLMS